MVHIFDGYVVKNVDHRLTRGWTTDWPAPELFFIGLYLEHGEEMVIEDAAPILEKKMWTRDWLANWKKVDQRLTHKHIYVCILFFCFSLSCSLSLSLSPLLFGPFLRDHLLRWVGQIHFIQMWCIFLTSALPFRVPYLKVTLQKRNAEFYRQDAFMGNEVSFAQNRSEYKRMFIGKLRCNSNHPRPTYLHQGMPNICHKKQEGVLWAKSLKITGQKNRTYGPWNPASVGKVQGHTQKGHRDNHFENI